MPNIETKIHLRPGTVPLEAQRKIVDLFFGNDPIFSPLRYGRFDGDALLESADFKQELVDFWSERGCLTVTADTDSHYVTILPNRNEESTWLGTLWWCTQQNAISDSWRAKHLAKVAEAMRILGAPLAYSGLDSDLEAKCWRLIDDPLGGQVKLPTLSSPREGIPGMFWRLFIGSPFTGHMPALQDLPPSQARNLGDGLWVILPYVDPVEADTDAGKDAEASLIERLGSDFFYDHKAHILPKRFPVLSY